MAKRRSSLAIPLALLALAGCTGTDHFLIHPHEAAPEVVLWTEDVERGDLRLHVEGARPPGKGPFPTVIVHPEEEEDATAMRGVIWDLAERGYVALAADYHRRIDGEFRRNMFAWRESGDLTLVIDTAVKLPQVDSGRIAAIGFSEGAVVSLLMAAHDPERIRAVVAYYPITDFPHWYAGERSGLPWIMFALGKWQMRDESGAETEDEFQRMLRLASPLGMAEYVRAPTLFIHGEDDTLLPIEESERMAESLREHGTKTKVLAVPDAGRFFNFRQPKEAEEAWQATLDWLERHLRPAAQGG